MVLLKEWTVSWILNEKKKKRVHISQESMTDHNYKKKVDKKKKRKATFFMHV